MIPSVDLEEKILEKVYDDADGRQMIAIPHLDLRPRRAKTKLIGIYSACVVSKTWVYTLHV